MSSTTLLEPLTNEARMRTTFPRFPTATPIPSPWAVLLIKFADDPGPDPDKTIYQKLFTPAGAGTYNMVRFFADMSHGRLDLSGSKVFGWYRLSVNRSIYVGNVYPQPTGKLNRDGLLDAGKTAATAAGVDLTKFAGVVVSGYGSTDLCGWVGGMAALCDQHSLQPSLLGQEMGHGYGLDHARRDGSTADYQDPWDIMSTDSWHWMEEPDSNFTDIGPGLNAWCMRSRGWLREGRVWSSPDPFLDTTITLRPLHRPDLGGFLAAELGPYLAEFRVPERWDGAIGAPCVLVHRFEDNHSYLMAGSAGQQALTTGSVFEAGRSDWPYAEFTHLDVVAIDAATERATLHISHRPAMTRAHTTELVGQIMGGIAVGGGGILILPGGRTKHVPPRGPVTELVGLVGELADRELAGDIALGLAQRRSTLRSIVSLCERLYEENDVVSTSPSRVTERSKKGTATSSGTSSRRQLGQSAATRQRRDGKGHPRETRKRTR